MYQSFSGTFSGEAFFSAGVPCSRVRARAVATSAQSLPPVLALVVGQLGQGLLVADGGEVGVLLPVPQPLPHDLLRGGFLALRQLRVQRQVVAQPGQRLPPQHQLHLVRQVLRVLPLPGGGQGGAARGVVAVLLAQVGGELRVGGEGVGVEAGGRDVPVLVLLAELGQGEPLGGVGGLGLPVEDGRQLAVEFDQAPLRLTNARRVGPGGFCEPSSWLRRRETSSANFPWRSRPDRGSGRPRRNSS